MLRLKKLVNLTSIFITCLFCVNLLSIYVAFKYCRQKKTCHKKAARTRAKGYRDLQNLKVKLDNKTKEAERYKKRWQRMQNVQGDTPRSKTRRMLGGVKVRESVRKTLLFHNALITGLRDKYKNLKSERGRYTQRSLHRECSRDTSLKNMLNRSWDFPEKEVQCLIKI